MTVCPRPEFEPSASPRTAPFPPSCCSIDGGRPMPLTRLDELAQVVVAHVHRSPLTS